MKRWLLLFSTPNFSSSKYTLGAKYFRNGKNKRLQRIDSLAENPSIRTRDLLTDVAISERGTLWNHKSNKEGVGFDCGQHR